MTEHIVAHRQSLFARISLALLLALGVVSSSHGGVRISEFLAANDGLLQDEDGDTPDWIEIQNDDAGAVSLAGWHLTDTATHLMKWTFPSTNLPPGGRLLVFASGKNRAVAGAPLHTNFQLDDRGGYLALVAADGVTVVFAFAPAYPAQRANVSFGTAREVVVTPLLSVGAGGRFLVPANGALGSAWMLPGFNDAAWTPVITGLGFDTANGPTNGSGPTNASVALGLDFDERASTPLTWPGFNSFVIHSNLSATAVQTNAVTRVFGAVSVTLSNTAPNGYDDRVRTTPTNAGAFTEAALLRDVVFSRSLTDNGGLDLAIGGLPPGQSYQVSVWSFDSGSAGARASDWFVNGLSVKSNYVFNGAVLPTSNNDYRFNFNASSSAGGQLLIQGRRHPGSVDGAGAAALGVFLNALQLTALGYRSLIATDIGAAMSNQNASVFIRLPFVVANPNAMQTLKLRMKYDDGFAAYLNGQLVAARNAPGSPQWNSTATTARANADGVVYEDIVLTNAPGLLVAGANVLAIQGLNVTASDGDFLLVPELQAVAANEFAGRYFKPPTPGVENAAGYSGLVADTKFSVDRGFFDAPFSLSITCATAGAEIRCTTNGSAPSPTNGFVFVSPIIVTGNSFLRAAAFLAGLLPSDIDTHSYIFLRDVLRQSNSLPNYPTTWQNSYPADYAMDSNIVQHPFYGTTISNDLRSIPSLSIVSDHHGLWNSATGIYPNATSSGPAWERAAAVELIRGDGHTEFATTCRIQMHGNASRDNLRTPKHSIGLGFNSDYGPTKLRYDWFGGGVDVANGIVLRSCGFVDGWASRYADDAIYTSADTGEVFRGLRYRPETTCYLRDVWVKDSFRAMGWSASRSQFVHLYLNGLYWGLYEPSERVDASYFTLLHGGPEGAWDVLVGEDNNGPPVIVDGSGNDWTNVLNLVNAGIASEAAYQAVAQRVDLDNLIDYMMLHIFAESEDWPRHNWFVAHRRATNGLPSTKFICSVWDQELSLDRLVRTGTRNRINVGTTVGEVYSPARVYAQLRAWPEFRRQFGDRIQKHFGNGGALTPSNNVARLLAPAAIIRDALTGESARWGDARKNPTPGNAFGTGVTFTRDEWWQPEIDKLATNFFQTLTMTNLARFRAGGLYPNLDAPGFNQIGGAVSNGFDLVLTQSNVGGVIYFTLDGGDPRVYGSGAVAASAQAFATPVTLNAPTLVRARVRNGSEWSALVEASFYPPQDLTKLSLTELMYNPPAVGLTNGDEFEFVELKNVGTNTLNLAGLTFATGVNFTFTNGTTLAPGAFFVLARQAVAFGSKYPGVVANGLYTGKLDNGGEMLTLALPFGGKVFSVTYGDAAPWPVTPDNAGFSLVPKISGATQAPDSGASWRASAQRGGSPGTDDPAPSVAAIVINEVLTASVPPMPDTIELFNPTSAAVDIGGWFLTDDPAAPKKFRIPDGTMIAANGYAVFDEPQFNKTPGTNGSFSLSSHGEAVYLLSGDANTNLTGSSHGFGFGAAAAGVPFGRHVNSVGEEQFPAQISATFSSVNLGPRVGPVVLNEIHYHPALDGDEFIELQNITEAAVPLFDPLHATNTWRLIGLDYTFPANITLDAHGLLLLVATNPASFRAKYGVPANVPILGPYSGALQDSGEQLELKRPDAPDTNGVFYITVDEVRYNDRSPWPPVADGGGPSLQRRDATAYGNDPINWQASGPTPGQSVHTADTDGDGLPDGWELAHGTNPLLPDADADADGDGATNGQEYIAGTDPQQAQSYLKVESVSTGSGWVALEFLAISNRTYTVVGKDSLDAPAWLKVADVPARSTNRLESVVDANPSLTNRFYRLVTPQVP